MRDTLVIRAKDSREVYRGKLKDLPFTEAVISKISMDLFADDDPCVIHRSFVVMQLAEEWKKTFGSEPKLSYAAVEKLITKINLSIDPSMSFELIDTSL